MSEGEQLVDIVVDTNIFAHCSSADESLRGPSVAFAQTLLSVSTMLTLDKGGLIYDEYTKQLRAGSVGYQTVVMLAGKQRVRFVDAPSAQDIKKCTQLVRKPRDRTFLRTAMSSSSKVLVSHDFEDFQPAKRRSIRKALSVDIVAAVEAAALL